jgi:HEAT repeat protein
MNRPAFLLAALVIGLAGLSGCRGYGPPLGEKSTTLLVGKHSGATAANLLSASAEERQWAVILLSESGDPDMLDAITAMLSPRIEPIPLVRATAAKGLRVMGDTRALPTLLSAALDIDPMVRAEVAKSLGALGGEDEVPTLSRLLRADSDDAVRLECAGALREIGGDTALPALAYALDDPDESVAFAAYDALLALTEQQLPPSRRAWESWLESKAGESG